MSSAWPARFQIHGPGRAATVIGALLCARGALCVHLSGGSEAGAAAAQAVLGPVPWTPRLRDEGAELLLLGVPDRVIPVAAEEASQIFGPETALWHLSGAVGTEVFPPSERPMRDCAAFHPLLSFPSRIPRHTDLGQALVAIEATTPEAQQKALATAENLGGRPIILRPGARPAYHAAASLAHNAMLALLGVATELMQSAGVSEDLARTALCDLSLDGLRVGRNQGLSDALTGPVVRGDLSTLLRHESALSALSPGLTPLYKELVRAQLHLLRGRGDSDGDRTDIRHWLEEDGR